MGESIAQAALPAIFSGIFGADEPSYQQPSMSQIQTPVQQALNALLIKQATSAAGWAQKFEDDFDRRKKVWENQKINYLNQTPTITVNNPAEQEPVTTNKQVEEEPKLKINPYMNNILDIYTQKNPKGGSALFNSGFANPGDAVVKGMKETGLDPDKLIEEATGYNKAQRQAMGVPDSYYMQMLPGLTNKVMDLYGAAKKDAEREALLKKISGVTK